MAFFYSNHTLLMENIYICTLKQNLILNHTTMKKYLMTMLALVFGLGLVQANPVGVSQAKYVGQQFVQANFEQSRQAQELTLVYTGTSTRGEACFYVFNVGNDGFVMVSADDFYRPIIGYSKNRSFDTNINPELGYMLNQLIASRTGKNTGKATPKVAAEWQSVMNSGKLISRNGGRGEFYLVQTQWDQGSPYNYFCPQAAGGPGGRVYAGCVATAMSQVMKYWNHPLQGTGSHTNYNSGFGPLTANFGATTYEWDKMPNKLTNNSPQEEIEAVALLMYHCGIAVDMHYAIDGSGAYSQDVPSRITQYFGYTNQAVLRGRDNYTYDNWSQMLKESFDMGWPLYYSGQSPEGGHAFVCDGYNDEGFFHYNWGWSGSGDDFYDFDQIDYNSSDGAIFNFVPTEVYNTTAQAPANLTVTPAANNELAATVSWTNPSKALNNSNLSSIDQIVVCRDGQVIYTEDNVTPGANMTITDNSVPRFDYFIYTVYAVTNGNHGKIVYSNKIGFGPTCGWTINVSQASFTGFRGGKIHVYNAAGTEFATVTTTNSSVQSFPVDMPLGNVSFAWTAPTQTGSFNMAFTIKDSQNNTVYTYSGSSDDMPVGVFYEGSNTCGNAVGDGVPTNCVALVDDENPTNINVSWDPIRDNGYGYVVYRDGLLYRLIPEGTSFVDENATIGGHCYVIGYLYDGGENGQYSNESCATSGACYPATNLDFEYTGSNFKIKLKWEKPEPSEGLSGYYLFRKFGEDGTYERVKSLSATATSYTDNSANQEGDYYYKLYAVYHSLGDCISAPAYWINDHNQFYLHAPYSYDGVNELEAGSVAIFPNPTTSSFTVEAEGLSHVTVYNLVGQKVYEQNCQDNKAVINMNVETGVYMVRVATSQGEITKRITIIK
jgi:hypothetical protein